MAEKKITNANNTFAIRLYSKLIKKEENLFISPFSIFSALAMTYAGARNNTSREFEDLLNIDIPKPRFHRMFNELSRIFQREGESDLHLANSIWIQINFSILQAFIDIIRENYDGEINKLDFGKKELASNTINKWVDEHTRGKINKIVTPDLFNFPVRLILVNAIYFKGLWDKPFKEKNTKDDKFTLINGEKVAISMMHQTTKFGYFENKDLQIIEFPYKGSFVFGSRESISMIIILPKAFDGMLRLNQILSIENLDKFVLNLETKKVEVHFPRFKLETIYGLKQTLTDLGLKDAFNQNADFSGVTDTPEGILIHEVIHKAFVDVNEEGTEAAAVTAVIALAGAAMVRPRPPPIFRADHPFLFLIRDVRSNLILFIGSVMNPKA